LRSRATLPGSVSLLALLIPQCSLLVQPCPSSADPLLTEEIVGREVVSIPDLQGEASWDLVLGLIPGEHGLLLGDDDLLLRHQVVKGEDVAPVEVAFTSE